MRYIYTLSDPSTMEIRYVGQTNDPKRRFISSSINESSDSYETYKAKWIRKVISNNLLPIMNIIDTCNSIEESNRLERDYVDRFTTEGVKLTNSHVNDVTDFSLQTREKISNAKKGKKLEEIVGLEKSIELKAYYSEKTKLNNPNKSNVQ